MSFGFGADAGVSPGGVVGAGTATGGAGTVGGGVFGAFGAPLEAAGFGTSISEAFSASKSGLLSRNVPGFPSSVVFQVSSGVFFRR